MDLLREKQRLRALSGPQDPGGGGGGGQTTVSQSTVPAYAQPYMEELLGKTQALTSTPYQQYQGDRIAAFTPLQQQAFQGAAQLAPAAQTGTASDIAQTAAERSMNAGSYQPGQFGTADWNTPGVAQSYMSPYIQQALIPQLNEARRQSEIGGQQQQAQATQAGAFGGYRDALERSERERNLGTLQNNIVSGGLQQAYQQGAGQFQSDAARALQTQQAGEQSRQFGAGLGLQGLQQALSGAGTLGQLGQQQFGQEQSALGTQAQLGGQQQNTQQQYLQQQYQDFLNQQNYPYKQLGFESDVLRGVPGTQSASTMYAAPPSTLSQMAGLGTLAYGLGKKRGGAIKADVTDVKPKQPSGLAELALHGMKGGARA